MVYAVARPSGDAPGGSRLGITVSKKVGTSVVRNQVKRWVRESYRRLAAERPLYADVVVIAKPAAATAGCRAIAAELRGLLLSVKGS